MTFPLSKRSNDDEKEQKSKVKAKDSSSKTEGEGGSKKGNKNKAARESKGPNSSNVKKNKAMKNTEGKDVTFNVSQKNTRSLNSGDRIEEMIREIGGHKGDAILINETGRPSKADILETHQVHIFMGAGNFENKHVVGMLLNKKWRKSIGQNTSANVPLQH